MNTIRWSTSQTFTSTQDGAMITQIIPGNLIIPAGVIVSVSNRCQGLYLQVMGNLYLYGTITMTARGAYVTGQNVGIEVYSNRNTITFNGANYGSLPTCRKIPATGASGGSGGSVTGGGKTVATAGGNTGTAGSGTTGTTGGGGGGCAGSISVLGTGGAGASGSSFSGGAGGGSAYQATGGAGTANGGPGGNGAWDGYGTVCYYMGGVGNPGGAGWFGNDTSGTGGLIIIVVLGYCYIASSGIISANGVDGEVDGSQLVIGLGGGGSGGGSINILYGTLSNSGTITANGGAGAYMVGQSVVTNGGAGGAGSYRLNSLRVAA